MSSLRVKIGQNNGLQCIFCLSRNLEKKTQIFKNGTENFWVRCIDCRKQFYSPREFMPKGLEKIRSRKIELKILNLLKETLIK